MLARLRAFRCTIVAQSLLLALGWLYRTDILRWWAEPYSDWWKAQDFLCYDCGGVSWPVELSFVLLSSWVMLAPVAASEAWLAGMRWAGRPAAFRYHWGFALASWCVALGSALAARQLSMQALVLL